MQMGDALVSTGLAAVGFNSVHLDDCIMNTQRNPTTNELEADPIRFPSGFKALGDYLHNRNISFALYTASSTSTCGGYPASKGYETLDAQTFAAWGTDYLKVDGCGDPTYYPTGYKLMGEALQNTNRSIVFSCSWPAYLGTDETVKPFSTMIADGCNLWRNYLDQGPTSGYLQGILEHFGNYSTTLAEWTGPGYYNDPDQLLIGLDCISDDLARSQMALYSILAAPLIMGNDVRKIKPSHLQILLNKDAIAVNQDPAVKAGIRLGGTAAQNAPTQVWYRSLANGDVAVALYNAGPAPSHPWHTNCDANAFNTTTNGYYAPKNPQPSSWCTIPEAFSEDLMNWYCCNTEDCAGYNYSSITNSGCWFTDTDGGFVAAENITGYVKNGFVPPSGSTQVISVDFASIGLFPGDPITVYDIWAQQVIMVTNASSYNATVPWQGTAFVRLSQ